MRRTHALAVTSARRAGAGGVAWLAVAALLALPASLSAQDGSASDSTWIQVTGDSPPSVHLAFEDLGSTRVPEVVVEEYEGYLSRLSSTCHTSTRELAQLAHGAVTLLETRSEGVDLSRLDFLRQLVRSIGDPLHGGPDCRSQASSVLVSMADGAGLRDRQLQSIRQLVEQLPAMSVGPGG